MPFGLYLTSSIHGLRAMSASLAPFMMSERLGFA